MQAAEVKSVARWWVTAALAVVVTAIELLCLINGQQLLGSGVSGGDSFYLKNVSVSAGSKVSKSRLSQSNCIASPTFLNWTTSFGTAERK